MTFDECVMECFRNQDLVHQFNRLTGRSLGVQAPRPPVVVAIDAACGHEPAMKEDDMRVFVAFVMECVWLRLPRDES